MHPPKLAIVMILIIDQQASDGVLQQMAVHLRTENLSSTQDCQQNQ